MTRRYVVQCGACGSRTVLNAERGRLNRVTVEHEDDCPFLEAIERDAGPDYVTTHGYPLTYTEAS
jgi:hypothetical protein